jgi:hypothetical protein
MATTTSSKAAGRVLLPSHVTPTKYDLHVTPNLTAFTFEGKVVIEMSTAAEIPQDQSNQITLHAKELLFHKAEYTVVAAEGEAAAVAAEEVRNK